MICGGFLLCSVLVFLLILYYFIRIRTFDVGGICSFAQPNFFFGSCFLLQLVKQNLLFATEIHMYVDFFCKENCFQLWYSSEFQLHITLFRYLLSSSVFSLFGLLWQAFGKIWSFIAVGASSILLNFPDACVAAAVLIWLELFLEDAPCYGFLYFLTMAFCSKIPSEGKDWCRLSTNWGSS